MERGTWIPGKRHQAIVKAELHREDYGALPEGMRAELIDGELWDLASPSRVHREIVHELDMKLGNHIDAHVGPCKAYPAPFAVNLLPMTPRSSSRTSRSCAIGISSPTAVARALPTSWWRSPSNPEMDYISKLNLYREGA